MVPPQRLVKRIVRTLEMFSSPEVYGIMFESRAHKAVAGLEEQWMKAEAEISSMPAF